MGALCQVLSISRWGHCPFLLAPMLQLLPSSPTLLPPLSRGGSFIPLSPLPPGLSSPSCPSRPSPGLLCWPALLCYSSTWSYPPALMTLIPTALPRSHQQLSKGWAAGTPGRCRLWGPMPCPEAWPLLAPSISCPPHLFFFCTLSLECLSLYFCLHGEAHPVSSPPCLQFLDGETALERGGDGPTGSWKAGHRPQSLCKILQGTRQLGSRGRSRHFTQPYHLTRPARGRQSGIQSYLPLEGPGSQRTNIRSLWNFYSLSHPKDPGTTKWVHWHVRMCAHIRTYTYTHNPGLGKHVTPRRSLGTVVSMNLCKSFRDSKPG